MYRTRSLKQRLEVYPITQGIYRNREDVAPRQRQGCLSLIGGDKRRYFLKEGAKCLVTYISPLRHQLGIMATSADNIFVSYFLNVYLDFKFCLTNRQQQINQLKQQLNTISIKHEPAQTVQFLQMLINYGYIRTSGSASAGRFVREANQWYHVTII